MSHTDEVLAEILAADEKVSQAEARMNVAKQEASARSKEYAEAVQDLRMIIGGAGRESPTPLFDQAEANQVEPGQGEPEYFPPFTGDEPPVRSEAEVDQEIYDEVKPRPRSRGRKTGRKSTKKRSKTDAN